MRPRGMYAFRELHNSLYGVLASVKRASHTVSIEFCTYLRGSNMLTDIEHLKK